jgi:hypothetical protein
MTNKTKKQPTGETNRHEPTITTNTLTTLIRFSYMSGHSSERQARQPRIEETVSQTTSASARPSARHSSPRRDQRRSRRSPSPQQRTDGGAGDGNTNTETALVVFGEQR